MKSHAKVKSKIGIEKLFDIITTELIKRGHISSLKEENVELLLILTVRKRICINEEKVSSFKFLSGVLDEFRFGPPSSEAHNPHIFRYVKETVDC